MFTLETEIPYHYHTKKNSAVYYRVKLTSSVIYLLIKSNILLQAHIHFLYPQSTMHKTCSLQTIFPPLSTTETSSWQEQLSPNVFKTLQTSCILEIYLHWKLLGKQWCKYDLIIAHEIQIIYINSLSDLWKEWRKLPLLLFTVGAVKTRPLIIYILHSTSQTLNPWVSAEFG